MAKTRWLQFGENRITKVVDRKWKQGLTGPVLKTAAWFCMVFCIFNLSWAVEMEPLENLTLSKLATEASPALGARPGNLSPMKEMDINVMVEMVWMGPVACLSLFAVKCVDKSPLLHFRVSKLPCYPSKFPNKSLTYELNYEKLVT